MPIPYNATSPQPGDLLSTSQPQLLTNFGSINTLITQDHVTFAGAIPGQHNKVSLVGLGNYPGALPVFNPLGMIGLFAATDPNTTKGELYINKTIGGGAPVIVQIAATESVLTNNATGSPALIPGTKGATGWTMLPSGIKLVWGTADTVGGTKTVILAGNQAFSTTLLSVQATIITSDVTSLVYALKIAASPSPNQFIVTTSTAVTNSGTPVNVSFMYLAIGY